MTTFSCAQVLLFVVAVAKSSNANPNRSMPEVNTSVGSVVGRSFSESYAFYSIPYGRAPVGHLRFQPPLPVSHGGRLNCSIPNFRRCYGYPVLCHSEKECETYSEDCLVLNVHVPSAFDLSLPHHGRDLLPVMVWIHGGGFTFGAGTEPQFDGQLLANTTNTVVVSINYRLNALGFLAFEEDGRRFDGNQGIKDQQLALKWIHDNIRNFGGNKHKVTLFGESAGAQSITLHLMSNKSKPLFKRAAIQSNPGAYKYPTRAEALRITEALLSALNCRGSRLQCLLEASPETLMRSHEAVVHAQTNIADSEEPYRPLLDGVEFSLQPFEYFSKRHPDKEIMIGTTSDEMAFLKLPTEERITKQQFMDESNKYIGNKFGSKAANKYLKKFGNAQDSNYKNLLAQEVADMLFVCPTRALARLLSADTATKNSNIFLYVFDYRIDAYNCEKIYGDPFADLFCKFPSHSAELAYLFNSIRHGLNLTSLGSRVSKILNRFWGHFAHHGKPHNHIRTWPPYKATAAMDGSIPPWTNIRLRPGVFLETNYHSDMCDFWDSTGIYVNLTSSTTLEPLKQTSSSGSNLLKSNSKPMSLFVSFIFIYYHFSAML